MAMNRAAARALENAVLDALEKSESPDDVRDEVEAAIELFEENDVTVVIKSDPDFELPEM